MFFTTKPSRYTAYASSVDQLADIPSVIKYRGSDKYQPAEHGVLAGMFVDSFVRHGYKITEEKYVVGNGGSTVMGALKLDLPETMDPELRVAIKDARSAFRGRNAAHGWLDDTAPIVPKDIELWASWRHGLDGEWGLRGPMVSALVRVCSNGMVVPLGVEQVRYIQQRHIHGVDFHELIEEGVGNFALQSVRLGDMKAGFIDMDCSDNEGDAIIVEAGRQGVMPWARCRDAANQWHEPNHPEFKDRNRWSLFNAFTEAVKGRSPALQAETLEALPGFIEAALASN